MAAERRVQSASGSETVEERGTVLLVDADEHSRDVYGTILDFAGLDVTAVEECGEALTILDSLDPAVLLVEPRSCDTDHLRALLDEVRSRDIPALVLTTAATRAQLDAMVREGHRAVLLKPVLPREVLAAVLHAMSGAPERWVASWER